MANKSWPVAVLCLLAVALAAVPPHPLKTNCEGWHRFGEHSRAPRAAQETAPGVLTPREAPQRVLAIMVEFPDQAFDEVPDYPDSVAHNQAYFDRFMLHLHDYCYDASHGAYGFEWQVYDRVLAEHTMGYYGDNDAREHLIELVVEVVGAIDAEIDFSQWDALVMFHAGAGEESDTDDLALEEIWSTFINLYDLWEVLDPEADTFEGIPTNDGTFVTEMSILPESEWQPYFTVGSRVLGMLGVLAHEFGHQLGLPTLYDNVSENGVSWGIGKWGLMGTGAWNADGYVPPMPCAWSRYYLGWETPLVITGSVNDAQLTYNLDSLDVLPRLARLDLSDREYFLLENRQQNPDNSTVTWYNDDGTVNYTEPSFTFQTVDNQEYYPAPNNHIPRFDFMTNRFKGCEWDFYLPGLGGPAVTDELEDGSGLLIWHIDENVIAAKFSDDFEINQVNGDENHKGVDLEEADGVQHMDSTNSNWYLGSPDDAYRLGNNTYFGKNRNPDTGQMSLPTAESYYGGCPIEVLDVGPTGLTMSFSTRFLWSLDAHFPNINPIPAGFADFDLDGENELFYPMPDGELKFWYDNGGNNWPSTVSSVYQYVWPWSWDDATGRFYMAGDVGMGAYYYTFDAQSHNIGTFLNYRWSGPVVAVPEPFMVDGHALHALLPLASTDGNEDDKVVGQDEEATTRWEQATPAPMASNLMVDETGFSVILNTGSELQLYRFDFTRHAESVVTLQRTIVDTVLFALQADIDPNTAGNEVTWITDDMRLWLATSTGELCGGFPVSLNVQAAACPALADVDHNGTLDIVVGGENRFDVVGYNGEILNQLMPSLTSPDSTFIAAGVLPVDVDGDGWVEFAGSFSQNRFCLWDDAEQHFAMMPGYPIAMPARSRLMPVPVADTLDYLYIPSDYGKVFRTQLPDPLPAQLDWSAGMGNLGRTATWLGAQPQNQYPAGNSVFYPGEVYLFPNPLNDIFGTTLTFHIRTRRNATVSLKVFDIAANCVYKTTVTCDADMPNREKINLNTSRMASGVYFAIVEAEGEIIRLPLAIEK